VGDGEGLGDGEGELGDGDGVGSAVAGNVVDCFTHCGGDPVYPRGHIRRGKSRAVAGTRQRAPGGDGDEPGGHSKFCCIGVVGGGVGVVVGGGGVHLNCTLGTCISPIGHAAGIKGVLMLPQNLYSSSTPPPNPGGSFVPGGHTGVGGGVGLAVGSGVGVEVGDGDGVGSVVAGNVVDCITHCGGVPVYPTGQESITGLLISKRLFVKQ
jgi:hypothetical protein